MGTQTPQTKKFIAFLRAINVGGHTIKMDALRKLFEGLGFTNVETFIASGNVIFETPPEGAESLEKKIESHLQANLGYEVATFLRTPTEVAEVVNYLPFPSSELEAEGNWLYIAFLPAPPEAESQVKLMALRNPVDDFHVHGREMYWLRRSKIGESTFSGALLEKTLGMPATMRNSTTVRKIAAKYAVPITLNDVIKKGNDAPK
jgi:uncharacterized protein (DUF1697 family)